MPQPDFIDKLAHALFNMMDDDTKMDDTKMNDDDTKMDDTKMNDDE